MTIHERMVARSEREKDLLKYGRSQERERIIKMLEDKRSEIEKIVIMSDELGETGSKWFYQDRIRELSDYIALIKGEK